jgi:lysophospholipase L1-like esterase
MSNRPILRRALLSARTAHVRFAWSAALALSIGACEDVTPSDLLDGSTPPWPAPDGSTQGTGDGGTTFPSVDGAVLAPDSSTPPWLIPDAATPTDGGVAVTDGSVATPDGSTPPPASGGLCEVPAKEIAVLGDSYIALSYTTVIPTDIYPFTTELEKLARSAGAVGASEKYREYAVSGAAMAPGPLALIKPIPQQLDDALKAGKTTLLIMDGGGNDVLLDNRDCLNFKSVAEVTASKQCTGVVDKTLQVAQQMVDKGAAAGVKAVVFFFYPHLPKDSLGGGSGANYVLDYAVPRIKGFCEGQTKVKCVFVDQRKGFDDGTWTGKDDGTGLPRPGLIEGDGIHPTPEGSKILAKTVWDAMNASCIAVK